MAQTGNKFELESNVIGKLQEIIRQLSVVDLSIASWNVPSRFTCQVDDEFHCSHPILLSQCVDPRLLRQDLGGVHRRQTGMSSPEISVTNSLKITAK